MFLATFLRPSYSEGVKTLSLKFILLGAVALSVIAVGATYGYKKLSSNDGVDVEQAAAREKEKELNERIAQLEQKLGNIETRATTSMERETATKTDTISGELSALKEQNLLLKKQLTVTKLALPVPPPAPITPPVPPPSQTNVTPQKGAIISSVKPAIAYISSRAGKGSGFVVAPNVVVTNEHVVRDSFRVYLHLSSGGTTTGYVSGRNKENDLAIITIPTTSITPLVFGDSGEASLKQGDALYAFGFPFGLSGDPSFNEGSLSRRLDFEGKNYLEISNPIHPGNSGGPLVNESGKVVGVDIAIYGNQSASGNLVGETIKFAIPGNAAKSVVDALIGKMRPLSVEKKRQIDQYEDFMDDFDTTIIAIGAEMIEASDAVTRNSTTDLKQSSADLDQLLGKLRNIKDRIPAFPFVNKFQNAVADITQLTQSSKELADGYIDYIAHGGDQNPDLNSVKYIQNVVETIKTSSNQYYDDRDALNASALEFLSY